MERVDDELAWSGLVSHILHALRGAGLEMAVADGLGSTHDFRLRARAAWHRRLRGERYLPDRDPALVRRWADRVASKMRGHDDVRLVVSPGTLPIACLPARFETAIWADATFHAFTSTYPGYERLARVTLRDGDAIDRKAYQRSALVCFASDWAADDAVQHYGVPRERIAVIPFGANCAAPYADRAEAMAGVDARTSRECRLVFMGVDWVRKGGPLALEVTRQLRDRGVPAILAVVGCAPPLAAVPRHVQCLGFLDKSDPAGWGRWDALMRGAHFLILPSTAECFGLVYAEASAYAVPSIARNVGGVSSVVRDGTNGLLFSADDDAGAYVDAIGALWSDPAAYRALASRSYEEWRTRLNWQTAGRHFVQRLETAGLLT